MRQHLPTLGLGFLVILCVTICVIQSEVDYVAFLLFGSALSGIACLISAPIVFFTARTRLRKQLAFVLVFIGLPLLLPMTFVLMLFWGGGIDLAH
ncbi:MAG: hypothetical protein ACYSU0_13205 [Planctomycetota bacterium]